MTNSFKGDLKSIPNWVSYGIYESHTPMLSAVLPHAFYYIYEIISFPSRLEKKKMNQTSFSYASGQQLKAYISLRSSELLQGNI